jgi:DNA-binding CsgD family transcriptional regulator
MDAHLPDPLTNAAAVARAVVVLGRDAATRDAAALAGISLEEAERAADCLAGVGVFVPARPLRFASAALAAALYEGIAAGERAVLHRRAVRLLAGSGAAWRHALAVEPASDDAVGDALIEGGRAALASGAPGLAVRLLERALLEPPPADRRNRARALLGVALARLGQRRAVSLLREAVAHDVPARCRARLAAELCDALWLGGDADAAIDLLGSCEESDLPCGIRAAQGACRGSAPAAALVRLARAGLAGATALERCCAVAALIACDELEAAREALRSLERAARGTGARLELDAIALLAARLECVERGVVGPGALLPGPDPGSAPWEEWGPGQVERFGTASARGSQLLSDAAGSAGTRRIALLEAAVTVLRGSPRQAALADGLLELGRALRHAGRRSAARVVLREALDLGQQLGLDGAAALAREELRVAGARPRRDQLSGPDSLTAAESRVAEVAASGLSNRDIASALFLSPKTVEMHLGRVYRKLGISSRAELPAGLGRALEVAA